MATAQKRTRKRQSPKGKATTRKPVNPRGTKPASKGTNRRKPTQGKPVTGGQTYLLTLLLGRCDLSGGYEVPKDSAEANAQIRAILGVPMDADRKTAQAALSKLRKSQRATANGQPINSRKELAASATKVRI
jgi:hypothetical protein